MEHNVLDVFRYQINKPELLPRFMDFCRVNKGKYGISLRSQTEDVYTTTTLFSEDLVKAFNDSLIYKWFTREIFINKNSVETRGPYSYSPRELLNIDNFEIDYEVLLSNGKPLQRKFVWSLEQKRDLILSILKDIPIGTFQAINYAKERRGKDLQIFKIIDGKQRLSTILEYIQGKFGFIYDEVEYFIDDLELYTKNKIRFNGLSFDIVYEYEDTRLTDEQLIAWFERVNYFGTPQDKEHLEYLKKK